MSTQIQITPKSGITIGTTPITSGTDTRILFQSGGVVSQSSNLTFDSSLGLIIGNNTLGYVKTSTQNISGANVGELTTYSLNNFPLVKLTGTDLSTYFSGRVGLYYGNTEKAYLKASSLGGEIGGFNSLLLKAQGALSTDIIQRWRNSADTANIGKITGDGAFTFGTYTNPNTRLSVSGGTIQGAYISGLGTAMYVQNETSSGTGYAAQFLGRQYGMGSPSGYNTYGILSGADTTNGVNFGIKAYAHNGATNYAGYFDATNGTVNYAIFVQRGKVNLGTLPTSSAGLSTGDIWNDGGVLKVV